jgi:hypothetical protein
LLHAVNVARDARRRHGANQKSMRGAMKKPGDPR